MFKPKKYHVMHSLINDDVLSNRESSRKGFNNACDKFADRERTLYEAIDKHYYLYGYEKAHYLRELLEKFFDLKFQMDGE